MEGVDGRKSTTGSGGLMARVEHPAETCSAVLGGARRFRAPLNFRDGGEGSGIFPKDVNTNEA